MPRVTAFVVLPEAVQSVGITGEDGIVSIKKDLLGRADAAVILFCQGDKSWSCNALRLDVNRDGLMAFEELNVELAGGLQILDRQRIDPKRDGASD